VRLWSRPRDRPKAFDAAAKRKLLPAGATFGRFVELPKDKLPAEEYRYNLLTREQIETMWPKAKA
jgi:hypothetical protein